MIPKQITKSVLKEITPANETHVVRLILHDVSNESRYLLRCRTRSYSFERNQQIGRHVLDIPVSIWMEGANTARWKDNISIAEDIRNSSRSVTIQVLPIDQADIAPVETGAPSEESPLPELKRLLDALEAPEPVHQCLRMIEGGESAESIRAYVDEVEAAIVPFGSDEGDGENSVPSETSGEAETPKLTPAERTAKAREAKARAKAEREAKLRESETTAPGVGASSDIL